MAKTRYYDTGDPVPYDGIYSTFCDNAQQQLYDTQIFPPCPRCYLAASWRLTQLQEAAQETTTKTAKKTASRKA